MEEQLIDAAKSGDLDDVETLIEQLAANNVRLNGVKDKLGATPLHWAAAKGHKEVAKLLLNHGCAVSAKNDTGDTPLHWSTFFSKPDLVDLLINFNADIYEANKKGVRPIDVDTVPAIKNKLLAHHDRLEEARATQTAENKRVSQFIQRPTSGVFDTASAATATDNDAAALQSSSEPPPPDPVESAPPTTTAPPPIPPKELKRRSVAPTPIIAAATVSADADTQSNTTTWQTMPPPPPPADDAPPPLPTNFFAPPPPPPPLPAANEGFDPDEEWDAIDSSPQTPMTYAPPATTAVTTAVATAVVTDNWKQSNPTPPPRPTLPPKAKPVVAVAPSPTMATATTPTTPITPVATTNGKTNVSSATSAANTVASLPRPVISAPKLIEVVEDDDENENGGDDDTVRIEFWDAQEEMMYQKMLVHFGKESAAKALEEVRAVREKRGEVPSWKRAAQPAATSASSSSSTQTSAPAASSSDGLATTNNDSQEAMFAKAMANNQASALATKSHTEEERSQYIKQREQNHTSPAATNAASHEAIEMDKDTEQAANLERQLREDAAFDHVDGVRKAIEAGVDLNSKDEEGMTAMMHATLSGHRRSLLALLKTKAKRNLKNRDGYTALHLAVVRRRTENAMLLIRYRAKVDVTERNDGRTPLMDAALRNDIAVVRATIEGGANIDRIDKTYKTALMLAASAEREDVVTILLQFGAAVNMQDKYGWTALMYAANAGNTQIVRALIEKGALTQLITTRGKTASQLATEAGFSDTAAMIEMPTTTLTASASVSKRRSSAVKKDRPVSMVAAPLDRTTAIVAEITNGLSKRSSIAQPSTSPLPSPHGTLKKTGAMSRTTTSDYVLDPDVTKWSLQDVSMWLRKLGSEFDPVIAIFLSNNIDGRRLLRMTDEKLEKMGVTSMGLRDDILEALNSKTNTTSI